MDCLNVLLAFSYSILAVNSGGSFETTTLPAPKMFRFDFDEVFTRSFTVYFHEYESKSCFFVDLKSRQVMILSYGPLTYTNGKEHPVTLVVTDNFNSIIHSSTHSDQEEERIIISKDGTHEVCFHVGIRREIQKVSFIVHIDGKEDDMRQYHSEVMDAAVEVQEAHENIQEQIKIVRNATNMCQRIQFQRAMKISGDHFRQMSLSSMIDRWSIIHIIVIVAIGFGQVYFFRNMFNIRDKYTKHHRMNTLT